jgi:polysaccharide deacetylase 2 family uncharacterized protein YibQ
MAKKKVARKRSAGKRTSKRKRTRKASSGSSLFKILGALAILVVLVVSAAITAHFLITPHRSKSVKQQAVTKRPTPQKKAVEKPAAALPTAQKPPTYEIYPARDLPGDRPPMPPVKRARPAVSIIIDDMGYNKAMSEKFCRLDAALTFSIFPHSPFKTNIIKNANDHGIEIMLHLPMEPNEYPRVNPGPGALYAAMTPDELLDQLNRNLDDVPLAKGVNNHMGSRLTGSSFQMNQIFSILKKRNLYFIDSRTTKETIVWQSARLLQVPFSQRDIFLDHVQERAFVEKQIRALIAAARRHGEAVGIGHPYPITLEVLAEMIPEIKKQVDIVPASQIVHLIPYT